MELIKSISEYPNGTKIVIEYRNGTRIRGEIDTIYETDNGLDLEEKGYQEYYACAIKILSVLQIAREDKMKFDIGSLIEVSELKPPSKIWLENGKIIWTEL